MLLIVFLRLSSLPSAARQPVHNLYKQDKGVIWLIRSKGAFLIHPWEQYLLSLENNDRLRNSARGTAAARRQVTLSGIKLSVWSAKSSSQESYLRALSVCLGFHLLLCQLKLFPVGQSAERNMRLASQSAHSHLSFSLVSRCHKS